MPSTCPKCRATLAEDAVCCAELVHTWRCRACYKVSSGFAIPYGRCFMCGGTLDIIEPYPFDDPMTVKPIRDAVQFELDSFHFYRLAMSRCSDPTLRAVFEQLHLHEVDHLHTLQDRYHTHLAPEVLELSPDADALLDRDLFAGLDPADPAEGPLGLYDLALIMERRTRDHFLALAKDLPEGPEKAVCLELAAEEEEHVAMLETEREQFVESRKRP